MTTSDAVDHPPHYTSHPSGIECIQITEHLSFCVGNAFKYLWRSGLKGSRLQDLEKARWYLCRALETEPRSKIRRPTRMVNACWSVVAAEMRARTRPVNSALQVFANLLALNIKTRTVLAVALAAVEGEIAEAKP